MDPNIRNIALLLEDAHDAMDSGEITLTRFRSIAKDLLDIPIENIDAEELKSLTNLTEG